MARSSFVPVPVAILQAAMKYHATPTATRKALSNAFLHCSLRLRGSVTRCWLNGLPGTTWDESQGPRSLAPPPPQGLKQSSALKPLHRSGYLLRKMFLPTVGSSRVHANFKRGVAAAEGNERPQPPQHHMGPSLQTPQ